MEKGKIHYFVLTCFLANITLLSGTLTNFLDIDELKNIHYDIDIREKPVVYGRPLHTEVVYLSSKFGQRYECQIPDVSDVGKDQEDEKTAAETGISDLLKPMENMPCLQKTKDWWTYEFCYGKYVQQFHMENNKKAGETITLGIFESEMDWENKTHSDAKRHRLNRYHSHKYVNGSPCDLTGKPREAEVRFLCAENELDTVSRIDEPESCRYVITVHTMRICHHPYLKPLSRSKPKTILCFPLLMPDQYEHYMHQQIANKYSREAQELAVDEGDGAAKENQDEPGNDEDSDEGDDEGLELLEEHHLRPDGSDEGTITLGTDDGEDVHIDAELAGVLGDVLTQVRDTLNDINGEISTTDSKSTMTADTETSDGTNDLTTKNSHDTKNEGMVDEVDDDIDDDKDDNIDEDDEDDPEIAELMKKDYQVLMKDLIQQASQDPDADRLLKLTDEIQATFEDLEEMERLLSKELDDDIMQTIDDLIKYADDTVIELGGEESSAPHQQDGLRDEDGDEDEDEDEDEEDDLPIVGNVQGTEEAKGGEMGKRREKKRNLEDHLTDTLNELIGKLKQRKKPSAASSSPPSPNPESVPQLLSQPDNLNSRVRVRVTRVKLDKENKAKSEQELKFYDTDHRDIEEAISDHLEKSGLNVKGMGEFELRVLSYVPEDWPDQGTEDDGFAILSEEESNYFRNMIFGLVTRADHEEYEKQERLMKNYGFQLGSTSDLDQVQGPEDLDLDHNEIQVLIPSVGPKGTGKTKVYDSASDPEN